MTDTPGATVVDPGKLSWLVGRWRLCLLHPGAWWSAGGLTVVVIALLPDALRGWTIAADDIQYFFFAQNHAIANSVAHGAWPLWDPLFGFGQPLLANPGNQALYPPSWINLLWPPEIAIVLYVGGHLLLAGLGTYALARRILHLSPWASWLAAACWIASGPLVSLVPRWQHFASAAWLPWVLLAALRCAAGPSTPRALTLAATLVLQWLSGSVEVAAASLLLALSSAALLRWRQPQSARFLLATWVPAGVIALALSAVLWLPALDLLRHSARSEMVAAGRMFWSVPPWRWLELITPLRLDELPIRPRLHSLLFGSTGTTIVRSLYLGATLSALALTAALTAYKRRGVAALLMTVLGATLLAAGPSVPGLSQLVELLPASIFRFPGKLLIFTSFAWALLGGFGLDAWQERLRSEAKADRARPAVLALAALPALAFVVVATTIPGVLAATVLVPPPPGAHVWDAVWLDAGMCAAATAIAISAAILMWLAARRPRLRPAAIGGVAVLAALDLIVPNHRVNQMVPAALVGRPPETAQRLRSYGADRIHVLENNSWTRGVGAPQSTGRWQVDPRSPLPPLLAQAHGVNVALGGRSASRWGLAGSYTYETLVVPTREQFGLGRLFARASNPAALVRLLQAGAVSHIVARDYDLPGLTLLDRIPSPLLAPILIYRVPAPLPRTFVVDRILAPADDADAIRLLLDPAFDLRRSAIVAGGPIPPPDPTFRGTSRMVASAPDRVEIDVECSAPAYVILLDTYDPGWRATVDGISAHVHRANYAFRAVSVPPGRHVVKMVYRPPAFAVGAGVSVIALAGTLVAIGFTVLRPTISLGTGSRHREGAKEASGKIDAHTA